MTRDRMADVIGVVLTGIGGLIMCIASWKACNDARRSAEMYRKAFGHVREARPTLPTWLHDRMPTWFLRWWYK